MTPVAGTFSALCRSLTVGVVLGAFALGAFLAAPPSDVPFNCDATGKTDATACLSAAINRSAARHQRLDLPAGTFMVSSLHIENATDLDIVGHRTTVVATDHIMPIFEIEHAVRFVLRDLVLRHEDDGWHQGVQLWFSHDVAIVGNDMRNESILVGDGERVSVGNNLIRTLSLYDTSYAAISYNLFNPGPFHAVSLNGGAHFNIEANEFAGSIIDDRN